MRKCKTCSRTDAETEFYGIRAKRNQCKECWRRLMNQRNAERRERKPVHVESAAVTLADCMVGRLS